MRLTIAIWTRWRGSLERMVRWLRSMHLHAMNHHHSAGSNGYYECRCGHREVRREAATYSPIDQKWLTGEKPPKGYFHAEALSVRSPLEFAAN